MTARSSITVEADPVDLGWVGASGQVGIEGPPPRALKAHDCHLRTNPPSLYLRDLRRRARRALQMADFESGLQLLKLLGDHVAMTLGVVAL